MKICEQSFDTECETLEEEECNTIYEEVCEPVYKVIQIVNENLFSKRNSFLRSLFLVTYALLQLGISIVED